MAQVARRSLAARRALLALALASALLLASLLMLRDEGDAAPRAFRDGFTVAESVPRRTESDGSAAATAVVPDVQVAIAGAEQGGRSTTTIKTQDGHEITILHPEGKKQVTTISRDEGGKITIENVASDDETRRPEELEQQDADARRGAEELEEEEGEEEDAADEAIIVSGAQQVKVTQLGRKVEVSTVEDAGDAR